MVEVLNDFELLQTDLLSDAWVEAVHNADFLEFQDIPPEYNDLQIDYNPVYQSIIECVESWLVTEPRGNENHLSWSVFIDEVAYRKVIAILGYHIYEGSNHVMNKEVRLRAVLAARVYCTMLSIPGFLLYDLYHCQLFANSLGCLGFIQRVCELYDYQKAMGNRIPDMVQQVNALVKQLQLFMAGVIFVIPQLTVEHSIHKYPDILDKLVDVTSGGYVNKMDIDKIELTKLSLDIYVVIENVLNDPNKRPIPEAIVNMFKCLHGKLVAACLDVRSTDYNVRASYVTYCGLLLSVYGKTGLNSFVVLLEHLCYAVDGMDRNEVRTCRVKLISGLMTLLPKSVHDKLLTWIIALSKSSKSTHRHTAVELLDQLLHPENKKDMTSPYYFVRGASGFSVETAVAVLNGVPLKEAKKLGLKNPAIAIRQENQPTNETNGNANELQNLDVSDEEMRGVLHQRVIPLPIGEILHALYMRVHDSSSSVRTRATTIIGKCFDKQSVVMKDAIKDLNGGSSRLKAMAARCMCDDRANVRRSGVNCLSRILDTQAEAPCEEDLAILVNMCRDACISVRSIAITTLGAMVTKCPSAAIIDAFLKGPLHQISDPENKIRDMLRGLFQGILINRIKKYSPGHEDPMPWMLLGGVIRLNLRHHLQKICALFASTTNHINVKLVDCLSTHLCQLGAARDLQALVMLVSVAREVDYHDLSFVLQYYYQLAEPSQNETRDPRLMMLTLELLTVWSAQLDDEARTMLRESLATMLASNFDDGCRIYYVSLAAHLDISNLTWAKGLMQLAEREALKDNVMEEWMRVADLSLVAPDKPSVATLHQFQIALRMLSKDGYTGTRAGAIVAAAGRLCMRSRDAAELLAPAAVALLHADAPIQARVNALLMLTDICTRYANIVEPMMDDVCACLNVTAPLLLRRYASRALTRLLLGGFLRLRTPLYYRYCGLLADDDHDVREPAEYYVTCILTPDSIFQHFVECIRHFNSPSYEYLSFESRQLVYDVLLQRLSLAQRLNAQVRLARGLLLGAADAAAEGDAPGAAARAELLDAVTVLSGPRLRLPRKPPQADEQIRDLDELEERITTNIVSSKMKQTTATVVVPAVLRLHAGLREGGGPLVAALARLATDLLTDYRQEIEELIDADEDVVEHIRQFRDNIELESVNGKARNLVTSSAPPEPDTPPESRRRRLPEPTDGPPHKRPLDI